MSNRTITIVNDNKDAIEVELLFSFVLENNNYIIYTKNEHDNEGNSIIYFGKIKESNDKQLLIPITDDLEWQKVKNVIRELLKNGKEVNKNE